MNDIREKILTRAVNHNFLARGGLHLLDTDQERKERLEKELKDVKDQLEKLSKVGALWIKLNKTKHIILSELSKIK